MKVPQIEYEESQETNTTKIGLLWQKTLTMI